jgi:hypothetical protein
MTTVLMRFRVAEFDAWRDGYLRAMAGPIGADVRSHRIWRGQDDPKLVVLEETYDSREAAQATIDNPQTEEAMKADGIDLASVALDYLDEVGS